MSSLPAASLPGATPPTHVLGVTGSGVEVRGFAAPAGDLVAWWHRLRDEHPASGLWPVLLGSDLGDLAAALTPESRDDYDDAAELRRATAMSTADLVALRAQRHARYADLDVDDTPPGDEPPPVVRRHAPTFTAAEQDGLVALVPATHGWQVPVILGWEGGVNYDMEPVDHGVVLRDWHERFGAELVSLTGDQVLEVVVRRPPTTPAEAHAVAREQYAYCGDVVDQGVGTIRELAQDQVGSGSWYFWWD
ncbi:DUF4253 domain-containing protein [Cellulomonas sp. S1-8]|uniref:DUF4253 domain-containing protein n=1 Tax=Cellulomonas sp. S1-8 TaxID=2904790 RepID=UPI0022444E1C|nr:DUF4253 domain-containing protein [Cellulomonas sp. S1-8]UZN03727.1 DUF4253 domain-containing protein [Cellulomonas sp. S1-8]